MPQLLRRLQRAQPRMHADDHQEAGLDVPDHIVLDRRNNAFYSVVYSVTSLFAAIEARRSQNEEIVARIEDGLPVGAGVGLEDKIHYVLLMKTDDPLISTFVLKGGRLRKPPYLRKS